MGAISYEVPINVQRMTIGVQGENNVREFLFDVTEWRNLTGDIGTAEMVVQRNGDASPYAAVITMHDENTVSWIPTSTDTEKVGAGKLQLMWIANGQTVKTKIFDMKVDPSLDYAVPDTSLDPWASWIPGIINADANYKGLTAQVNDLKQRQTSPYNFKGSLASAAALPAASAANANDTYYLIAEKYRVTWTGSAWQQSSMDESQYADELAEVKNDLDYTREPSGINLFNPYTLRDRTGIDSNTGEDSPSNAYSASDYIPVSGQTIIKPFEWSGTGARIWIFRYDENKVFINRNVQPPGSFPDGYTINQTGYIRIMLDNGANANAYENPWKYMVASAGTPMDEFVPYYSEIDSIARLAAAKAFIRHNSEGITDADAITEDGCYYLSSTYVSNLPESSGAWYLLSFSLNAANTMQLAYEAHGRKPFLRAQANGTWGPWEQIGTEAVRDTSVTSSIAMFPSVGCCGDSFTAGYLYNKPDSGWYDPDYVPNGEYPAIGYPAVMGRLYGVEVTPYAMSGLTSTAWRTASRGLPALLEDEPKYLYIIALGLNDKTQSVPLGEEADIDQEPSSPTYLGNLGAIIRAIQDHAPRAKIILCKSLWVYSSGGVSPNAYYSYISEGVELLSEHLGIPYIETLGDPYFCSDAYINGLKGLHPTAPLYAGMGRRIGELVGKCVIENPDYFFNFYVPNN